MLLTGLVVMVFNTEVPTDEPSHSSRSYEAYDYVNLFLCCARHSVNATNFEGPNDRLCPFTKSSENWLNYLVLTDCSIILLRGDRHFSVISWPIPFPMFCAYVLLRSFSLRPPSSVSVWPWYSVSHAC